MKAIFLQFKKALVTLLFLSLVVGFSNNVKAGGLVGGDISYQCTSTPGIYNVTVKAYRDCSGVSFCTGCATAIPNGTVTGCAAAFTTQITGLSPGFLGVNYGSFSLTAVAATSGYDIIQTCNSNTSICTNCNTRAAGTFTTGIEVFTFEGTADLTAIPATSCKIGLTASLCCRSAYLQTVIPYNYFIIAELNRCQTACNSAPVFTNDAVVAVCNGVDFVYNLGAIDVDGDSLSYAFGTAYSALNTEVTYFSPYSSSYLIPYFGAPNINAAYPAGMRIDPITGDIIFRPTAVINSYLIVEVTQWKLVSGVRVNVGKTRRDIEFLSLSCASNKIPVLKTYKNGVSQNGNQNFVAYAGQQFCIDLVAQDQAVTPTDPLTADTTDIRWNSPGLVDNTMTGATFTRNYILANRTINGPKADSFKFCWTPPIAAIRSLPHLFTVSGSDRFCPLRAVFTKGITITVETPRMVINATTKKVFCNNKVTSFNIDYSANGVNLLSNNVFTVQLSDSLGSFTNATNIGTTSNTVSSGAVLATLPSGLLLNKTYKLRLLSSSDNNVETTPYDLSLVQGYNQPIITANNDSICEGLNATISLNSTANILNYKWLLNNLIITSAVSNSLLVYTTGIYKLTINNTGCSDTSNEQTIVVNANSVANFTINNAAQCLTGNSFGFTNSSTNSNSQTWSFGDATNASVLSPTKTYNNAGNFTVKLVAKNIGNCNDSITKTIVVNTQPTIGTITGNAAPTSITAPYAYSVSSQANTTYNWSATNGTIQSGQGTNAINIIWPTIGNGSLKAKITNNNSCTDSTSLLVNITSVGINNLSSDNDLKVFPNPTKTSITITNKSNLVGKKYIITNLVGQTVISGKLNLDETIVNLETLQSGIYLLSIDNINKQSIKVIKE